MLGTTKKPGPLRAGSVERSNVCSKLLHVAVGRLTEERTGGRKGSHVDATVHVLRQGRRVAVREANAKDTRMVRGGTRRLAVCGRQQVRVRIGVIEARAVGQGKSHRTRGNSVFAGGVTILERARRL